MPLGHTTPDRGLIRDAAAGEASEREPSPRRLRRRRWLLVALVVLIGGMAVSATAGLLLHASGERRERQAFQSTASNVAVTLGTLLRRDTDFVPRSGRSSRCART